MMLASLPEKANNSTDPSQADEGTLRKKFASNIERSAVHGSDAPETAAVELAYEWFPGDNATPPVATTASPDINRAR